MTEPQTDLVAAAREFATNVFNNKVSKSFTYHNLDHTRQVVRAAEEMADYYQLLPEDRNAVVIAAWLHDVGFASGESKGHEAVSAQMAADLLKQHNADPLLIEKVTKCIEATKMPQAPGPLIEQIICDADLFHLGTEEFNLRNNELRHELSEISQEKISRKKWRKMNINFMENHSYFTDYGKRKLQPVKEKHIEELKNGEDGQGRKNDKQAKKKDDMLAVLKEEIPVDASQENKKGKDKDSQTDRGISTVFRIMANNHSNLSQMADSKANIMISVNSIILSVVISVLLRRLEEDTYLIIPTIILILVCVATIVFAVKATRPNISEGTFTKDDITSKKTNLLFFGNFHNMTLPDYDWAMREMLKSRDYLYGSMVKDIYFLGVVLAKKYRMLRISYNIFMYGIIITMVGYGIAVISKTLFFTTEVQVAPISP